MNEEKLCLDCGTPLHGRADKKFCNDLCRNNYNNQLNSSSYNLVRNINNILKRNRRILEDLNPGGKTKTTRKKLLSKGFDFEYHTHVMKNQDSEEMLAFCCDFGVGKVNNDRYEIISMMLFYADHSGS